MSAVPQSSTQSSIVQINEWFFARDRDFLALINSQCDLLVRTATALNESIRDAHMEPQDLHLFDELEHLKEEIKRRNLDTLNRTFVTAPLERNDIYLAVSSIDSIMVHLQNTMRMAVSLNISASDELKEMTHLLHMGVVAIHDGYEKLSQEKDVEEDVVLAHNLADKMEEKYFRSLATIFSFDVQVRNLQVGAEQAKPSAMIQVIDVFKMREIFRYFFDAANELNRAAQVLHEIAIKNA